MKKSIQIGFVLLILVWTGKSYAQNVGIGTQTPDQSAILELQSTNQGLLVPRMTYNQITAIPNPLEGLIVYDIENHCLRIFILGVWECLYSTTGQPPSSKPNHYAIDPNFDVLNLPTSTMQQAHADWWTGYQSPNNLYEVSPAELFAPADINNWKSNGSYSLARHGGNFLYTLTELMRTTCDPNALTELISWSQQIRSNLQDHDGRGYVYFEYTAVVASNPSDNQHNLDDTQWLDEGMAAAVLSHIAYVMHLNRDLSTVAGAEADFWFQYLDENWIPKWNYRTTYGTANQITPAPALGLQNAVNWNGGVGGSGGNAGDIVLWGGADYYDSGKQGPRFNDIPGIVHEFPANNHAHPYIMSLYMYYVMGQYFTDTGLTPKGAYLTGTAQDYINEAQTRHDWWYQKIISQPDGSLEWQHFLHMPSSGTRTSWYTHPTVTYLTLLHWESFGNFASDTDMTAYSKVFYSGNSNDNTDVYDPGNISTMKRDTDGGGGDVNFAMLHNGLLSCWDNSGTLLSLNNQAIISPTSHHINQNTVYQHLIHYNIILSCEFNSQ